MRAHTRQTSNHSLCWCVYNYRPGSLHDSVKALFSRANVFVVHLYTMCVCIYVDCLYLRTYICVLSRVPQPIILRVRPCFQIDCMNGIFLVCEIDTNAAFESRFNVHTHVCVCAFQSLLVYCVQCKCYEGLYRSLTNAIIGER